MRIGIDLGHECYPDTGAVGVVTEESIIDNVGYKVISGLRSLGYEVIELRPSSANSVGNSLWQRYTKSDNYNCDLCVSIHANCGGGHGVEIFTYNARKDERAVNVLNNLVNIGFTNRGIKDGKGLAMVRRPAAVAMLIEICFCDSQNDVLIYQNNIQSITNAIISGISGQSFSKYKPGWNLDENGWWYATDTEHYAQDEWKLIDGKWYHFNNGGYCSKGWLCDSEDGRWYYLNPTKTSQFKECELVTGWLTYKGKQCYLSKCRDNINDINTGECIIGRKYSIDGVEYEFDNNGYLI